MRRGPNPNDLVAGISLTTTGEDSSPSISGHDAANETAFSLRDIIPTCRFLSTEDLTFCSVAESAATAETGQLVVYRIGQDCPSRLVADAMARGAAGIITEQVLPCPLPQAIVGDMEVALAQIASETEDRPDRKLLTIGVVGSSGKTTTTLLISSLLRGSGIRTAYQSDLGESDGVVQTTSCDAVPSGSNLISWLSEAVDCQCNASVIEISEEQARHGQYDAIEFDLLVVTGSATCNGDFGPSGLQCAMDRLTRDGVVIAPADDSRAMRTIRESGVKCVTYGIRKAGDVSAKIIEQAGGLTTLLVTHRDTTAVMETSLCGAGMASNHAAAVMVGLLLGQPLHEIVERLGELRTIPGRGQRLAELGQPTVVLESGGSPERLAVALRTHRSMKSGGKLWCVLAIDSMSDEAELATCGSHLERFADVSIVTATPNSKPKFLSTSHHVLDGVTKCAAFRLVADRQRAVDWSLAEAGPRDTIVVITNDRNGTPHSHRADLEKLENSVEKARSRRRESNSPQSDGPIQLKIVG